LADPGTFLEHDADFEACDRIEFPNTLRSWRLQGRKPAKRKPSLPGGAPLTGNDTALFAMESGFMMGSMSPTVGEKITRLFEYAVR
jgi:acetyl-CoA carboxylase beta subunit